MNSATFGFRPFLDGFYDAELDLQRHVYRRSLEQFACWELHKDGFTSVSAVKAWQQHLRERTLAGLGGLPPDGTPLLPEQRGARHGAGFDIELVIFQSLPQVYVTANLYLPHNLQGRTGAVVFVCGHGLEAKAHTTYQAVCQRLARNGLVVLAIDPIGQGERKSFLEADGREQVRWGTVEHTYAGYGPWWLGQSIARYFIHDARRAIDYLLTRPEVDPERIGITGSSGGGTQSALVMLVEPRLAAAAPGTFITRRREYMWTGQEQDAEQVLPGGTAAGIDHEDSLIAMAPRPVCVLAVDYDFFALEGTVATVKRAQRIYDLFGKPDNLRFVRARSSHQYHPELAKAVTRFFVQHLAGRDATTVDDTDPQLLEPSELRCTASGQVLLDRPQTRRVFDLTLAEYEARPRPTADPAVRAEAARVWLQAAVNRHRRPLPEFFPRWLAPSRSGDAAIRRVFWRPEQDIFNAGVLVQPAEGEFKSLVIALFDNGSAELSERGDWLEQRLAARQAVLVLDVRGSGALAPRSINARSGVGAAAAEDPYATRYKLMTDLIWLDDSLAAMQLYDVLRCLEFVRADPELALAGRSAHLFGAGRGSFRAYLGGVLDLGVERIELEQPLPDLTAPVTQRLFHDGPVNLRTLPEYLLPGLLAKMDLSELQALADPKAAEVTVQPANGKSH